MKKTKTIISALLGNALEYYDVTLYGFFSLLISPLFFPAENVSTSRIASLSVFAIGFFMRPLGGLIFGYIGDKWGRKKALTLSIFLVTIPTTIIGILPTYAEIGLIAPLVLICCRLLQGLSSGGEYAGAAIYIAEQGKTSKPYLILSFLPVSSIIGALLGTILGVICTLPSMPNWSWRLPFILGAFLGLYGFYLRKKLRETPEFIQDTRLNKIANSPILEVFKKDRKAALTVFIFAGYSMMLFYMPTNYLVTVKFMSLYPPHFSMAINSVFMILLVIFLPLAGYLADRVGGLKVMQASCLMTFMSAFPIFWLTDFHSSLIALMLALSLMSFITALFVAPSVNFIVRLFKSYDRYSGVAFFQGLGDAILGGTTPLISLWLVQTFSAPLSPALYLMLISAVTFIIIKSLYKNNI